jgi:hypothetical protein
MVDFASQLYQVCEPHLAESAGKRAIEEARRS